MRWELQLTATETDDIDALNRLARHETLDKAGQWRPLFDEPQPVLIVEGTDWTALHQLIIDAGAAIIGPGIDEPFETEEEIRTRWLDALDDIV